MKPPRAHGKIEIYQFIDFLLVFSAYDIGGLLPNVHEGKDSSETKENGRRPG